MKPKKKSPAQDRSTPANNRQAIQDQVKSDNRDPVASSKNQAGNQSWMRDNANPPQTNPWAWIASGIFMVGWLIYLCYVALF